MAQVFPAELLRFRVQKDISYRAAVDAVSRIQDTARRIEWYEAVDENVLLWYLQYEMLPQILITDSLLAFDDYICQLNWVELYQFDLMIEQKP